MLGAGPYGNFASQGYKKMDLCLSVAFLFPSSWNGVSISRLFKPRIVMVEYWTAESFNNVTSNWTSQTEHMVHQRCQNASDVNFKFLHFDQKADWKNLNFNNLFCVCRKSPKPTKEQHRAWTFMSIFILKYQKCTMEMIPCQVLGLFFLHLQNTGVCASQQCSVNQHVRQTHRSYTKSGTRRSVASAFKTSTTTYCSYSCEVLSKTVQQVPLTPTKTIGYFTYRSLNTKLECLHACSCNWFHRTRVHCFFFHFGNSQLFVFLPSVLCLVHFAAFWLPENAHYNVVFKAWTMQPRYISWICYVVCLIKTLEFGVCFTHLYGTCPVKSIQFLYLWKKNFNTHI